MANSNGEWQMANSNGDGDDSVGVVVVDGTAKNCEIDERFSYSRFNAGKQGATALEHRIGEKGFSPIERVFFNRFRPRVYGPMPDTMSSSPS